MLADAARTYLQRYGVRAGTRAVIVTADDSAYRTALALHQAGVTIAAVADRRAAPAGPLIAAVRDAGIAVHASAAVAGTAGRLRIRAVRLAGGLTAIPCDTLLMCGGWTPSVHLHSQSRGKLRFDDTIGAFVPDATSARACSAGGCTGMFDLAACLDAGYAAGEAAVRGPRDFTAFRCVRRDGVRPPAASTPAVRRIPRHSSICRTTSPPRTCTSPRARASARSSM